MFERNTLWHNQSLMLTRAATLSRCDLRVFFTGLVLLLSAQAIWANQFSDYHRRVHQAVTALDTLAQADENESVASFMARDSQTVASVRTLLPPEETVDLNGTSFSVENSWLHQELDKYSSDRTATRYEALKRTTERLKAIDERLTELEKPAAAPTNSKEEERRKLAEILQRPEYAGKKAPDESALARLQERIAKWLRDLLPKPKPMSSGSAGVISRTAQVLVILLALGVLAFVLRLFLPRMLRSRGSKKKVKEKARIVLGERLEPDQSARDLLTEAEALARRGELRAAIRKGYIALLVELGDRKIISLAQYKTNRDYLRAVRQVEPLYGNVKQLTDSFELHWYGLAQTTETDWLAFRSAYKQALR
jgi:hypothetical protein